MGTLLTGSLKGTKKGDRLQSAVNYQRSWISEDITVISQIKVSSSLQLLSFNRLPAQSPIGLIVYKILYLRFNFSSKHKPLTVPYERH